MKVFLFYSLLRRKEEDQYILVDSGTTECYRAKKRHLGNSHCKKKDPLVIKTPQSNQIHRMWKLKKIRNIQNIAFILDILAYVGAL